MVSAQIFLVCSTLALAAAGSGNSRCLPPLGKMPFDADKFSGDWFVAGGVHTNVGEKTPPPCVKASYAVHRDGNRTSAKMEFTSSSAGKVRTLGSSVGESVMPGKDSVMQAKWTIAGKLMDGVIRQSVLATDYTRFAVFYACLPFYHEDTNTFDKMEVIDVWSRTAVIDAPLLDAVRVVLAGFGLSTDSEEFLVVDNKAC